MQTKNRLIALVFAISVTALCSHAQTIDSEKKTLTASQMNALKPKAVLESRRETKAKPTQNNQKSTAAVPFVQPPRQENQPNPAAERAMAQKKDFDKLTVGNGVGLDLPAAPQPKPSGP